MAEFACPLKLDSMSISVQEMAIKGQEPPAKFLYKDSINGVQGDVLPLMQVPVIDMSLLASPSASRKELERLGSAISSYGCFLGINHGVSSSLLDKVHLVTKQFFALPMEDKRKYARQVDSTEGYGTDKILSENQILDWVDRLYLTISPEDQRKLKLWPENPEAFREILKEYTAKLKPLIEIVLKAMARSLNLEEKCFLEKYGDRPIVWARFNFYPPCSRPDLVLGLKSHCDGSAITIVLQDSEVEGLQLLKDEQWFRVPTMPQALLIIAGDQMEIMSNGLFKSPTHRAVTNLKKQRISLAVFCTPDPENDIAPVDGLVNETQPRLHKTVKDYSRIYFRYYQQGKRATEALKISY